MNFLKVHDFDAQPSMELCRGVPQYVFSCIKLNYREADFSLRQKITLKLLRATQQWNSLF